MGQLHLYRGSAVDRVDVLVHSVQQPQQELLGVVLSVPFELQGVLRHGVLKQMDHKSQNASPGNIC